MFYKNIYEMNKSVEEINNKKKKQQPIWKYFSKAKYQILFDLLMKSCDGGWAKLNLRNYLK